MDQAVEQSPSFTISTYRRPSSHHGNTSRHYGTVFARTHGQRIETGWIFFECVKEKVGCMNLRLQDGTLIKRLGRDCEKPTTVEKQKIHNNCRAVVWGSFLPSSWQWKQGSPLSSGRRWRQTQDERILQSVLEKNDPIAQKSTTFRKWLTIDLQRAQWEIIWHSFRVFFWSHNIFLNQFNPNMSLLVIFNLLMLWNVLFHPKKLVPCILIPPK